MYNGYGNFSSMDLCFDISEWGFPQPPASRNPARRPSPNVTPQHELRAKQLRAGNAIPGSAPNQPFFGMTLVSCERGDMRQSPRGLYVYSDQGQVEIELPANRSPRALVMAEFHDAITGKARALHDGRWGLANLEVCIAAIASSNSGRDVVLTEQIPVPV